MCAWIGGSETIRTAGAISELGMNTSRTNVIVAGVCNQRRCGRERT